MIIDADCHISSARHDEYAMTAEDLLPLMDRAEIDRALIWLKPPYDRAIEPENEAVHRAVEQHSDRFIGFGWTNPRLGEERAAAAIDRCIEEYGFLGVKFNGAQDGYVIDDERVLPLIERVTSRGRIVAFHIGGDFPENTHPMRLGSIAREFPQATFLMIHMGGAAFPALERAAIEVASEHQNVHVIGSAIHERAILQAVDSLGAERVSFGSDMPFFLNHVRLGMYRAMLRDHPERDAELILGGNMVRLLGLSE